ncbi:unnamed protein product, partial [Vitis vinifera]|uniref:Uncharacterized protein n=1 Tax=Vitis vinifera TaxID=29760 RepID=E0CQ13_VITVI
MDFHITPHAMRTDLLLSF